MSDRAKSVSLRRINLETDIDHIYRWLGDEDVHRWYDEGEHSIENYRKQFAHEDTIHKFIVEINGQPVGYVQAYFLSDEPEYAAQLGLDQDAVSIDIFIGEQALRGQGWGSVVLDAVLERVVFGSMSANLACICPDPENLRAVRSYEKAGFHGDRVVWVDGDHPGDTGYERIMLLTREEFEQRRN